MPFASTQWPNTHGIIFSYRIYFTRHHSRTDTCTAIDVSIEWLLTCTNNPSCRYNLGKVLESMNEFEAASDSFATALQVKTTSPVVPFSAVPLCFE